MSLAYWNTAKALFWIIVRQQPADLLLDEDHELALAVVLLSCHQFSRSNVLELTRLPLHLDLVRTPSVQAITTALDELSAALRATHLFCPDADEITEVHSSIEGFYIESNLGKKFRVTFPAGMVQRQWPPERQNGEKRESKPRYDADGFFAEAVWLLKRKKGIRPGFSEATFKECMLDWIVEQSGFEPSSKWVREHLALARQAYEKV